VGPRAGRRGAAARRRFALLNVRYCAPTIDVCRDPAVYAITGEWPTHTNSSASSSRWPLRQSGAGRSGMLKGSLPCGWDPHAGAFRCSTGPNFDDRHPRGSLIIFPGSTDHQDRSASDAVAQASR
jgi:hypothetical protein